MGKAYSTQMRKDESRSHRVSFPQIRPPLAASQIKSPGIAHASVQNRMIQWSRRSPDRCEIS